MIRSLRARHRWMILAIALVVAVGFIAALAGRRPIPRVEHLPALLSVPAPPPEAIVFDARTLWAPLQIRTAIFLADTAEVRYGLWLQSESYLQYPDVLVYWSRAEISAPGPLPGDAVLLGKLVDKRPNAFALPAAYRTAGGSLILYSLAYGEMFAAAAIPAPSGPAGRQRR